MGTGSAEAGGTAEPDDREIGRRFAEGDPQALASAYARWAGQVHGMAVRAFGPGPDAEDVTQQTFVVRLDGTGGLHAGEGAPAGLAGGRVPPQDRRHLGPAGP